MDDYRDSRPTRLGGPVKTEATELKCCESIDEQDGADVLIAIVPLRDIVEGDNVLFDDFTVSTA